VGAQIYKVLIISLKEFTVQEKTTIQKTIQQRVVNAREGCRKVLQELNEEKMMA
jgi:hypothetical protein